MGKPEEVAYLVAFLCSEMSALINGSQISIDGGQSKAF
jgi:3-oxoacyl-[acyl-carrier protein] reductase